MTASTCDVCGDVLNEDNLGQMTADCQMCQGCCRKYQADEPTGEYKTVTAEEFKESVKKARTYYMPELGGES